MMYMHARADRQDAGVPHEQYRLAGAEYRCALQEPRASRALLRVARAAPMHLAFPGQQRERREDAGLVRRRHLRARRDRPKAAPNRYTSLYTCLQILSVSASEKTQLSCALHADSALAESVESDTNRFCSRFNLAVVSRAHVVVLPRRTTLSASCRHTRG